jgi:hypothetical protein
MKTCSKCHNEQPLSNFYASSRHKSGYLSWCKTCESERCKINAQKNRDNRLLKARQWREANKDKQQSSTKKWREKNPERLKQTYRQWAENNRDKINAKWMKRDASKKQRTPLWLTDDDLWMIEEVYSLSQLRQEITGIKWHVDHIVPLQGKTVSGLHVPWNLQVIPAQANQQKSNRF